ncbi:MAG: hypothetical protein J5694_05410 [Erysipelotrichaceae bacterium]|nr:hypothetical protein [Erysipelotrichaceae bacterium]MBO4538286.1 hypothetical protein [Erysipelotrichaceae bacterium]
MDRIISILRQAQVSDWQLVENRTISHQAFFIGQKLDQHRISDTDSYKLTVYMDVDGKRGSAEQEIFLSQSDGEIREVVDKMKFSASIALNPHFELVSDEAHHEDMAEADLLESFGKVIAAVQSINGRGNEKINSYEVFVNQDYYHMVNSRGCDISFNQLAEELEIVITSLADGREVEIYYMLTCGADQTVENIVGRIENVFTLAADRSQAQPCKTMLNAHVIMTGEDMKEFFAYFLAKTNTANIYRRTSQVKIGDSFQSGEGDKISMQIRKQLPYSSANQPYALDGCRARDYDLVRDGVCVSYHGDNATARYLGIDDIAPAFNFVVSPGSRSLEEMESQPYLKVVQFSGLMVNPITGDFGGEFRLAYLYDGEKVTPVTSGSITGNMNTALNNCYLSRESMQLDNCIVPEAVELFDISVAGN